MLDPPRLSGVDPSSGLSRGLLAVGRRGELPFRLLHGEPLYARALRALAEVAGPVMVAVDVPDRSRVSEDVERWGLTASVFAGDEWWDAVRASGAGLLVHDPLCPLISAEFLRSVVEQGRARPHVSFAAVRPVTDTLKAVVDGQISGTIDREGLAAVSSPALVSSEVVGGDVGEKAPPVHDFAELVRWLRLRGEVKLVGAPSLGRRVEHAGAVHLLECVDEVERMRAELRLPSSAGSSA